MVSFRRTKYWSAPPRGILSAVVIGVTTLSSCCSALAPVGVSRLPPLSASSLTGGAGGGSGSGEAADIVARLGLAGSLFPEEIVRMQRNYNQSVTKLAEALIGRNKIADKPLIYVHVHKSLGTWICWVSRKNNAKSPNDPDCATHDDWIWTTNSWSFYDTVNGCSRRAAQIRGNNWTFMEIERWVDFQDDRVHGDWCPEKMVYATILRDPIERAKSQMYANRQTQDQVKGWLAAGQSFKEPHSYVASHIPYDNYYIRTFCGRQCHFLGFGSITREHLELAKKRLLQLDAVLTVEDLLTQLVQIKALTHWSDAAGKEGDHVVSNNGCASRMSSVECQAFALDAESLAMLKRSNALDLELYEFAKQVSADKTLKFLK